MFTEAPSFKYKQQQFEAETVSGFLVINHYLQLIINVFMGLCNTNVP